MADQQPPPHKLLTARGVGIKNTEMLEQAQESFGEDILERVFECNREALIEPPAPPAAAEPPRVQDLVEHLPDVTGAVGIVTTCLSACPPEAVARVSEVYLRELANATAQPAAPERVLHMVAMMRALFNVNPELFDAIMARAFTHG